MRGRNRLAPLLAILLAVSTAAAAADRSANRRGSIELTPCLIPGGRGIMLCGSHEVFEDRARGAGRKLSLNLAVLAARSKNPKPDPIFWITGGPGGSAVAWAYDYRGTWMHKDRDLVLVDQRGAGESNRLVCDVPGSPSDLQGYMETYFGRPERFRACRAELERIANLEMYTTAIAMDDLNEVRQAMGYDRINLVGGSYGTRAALVYMRRHPGSVRSALLSGLAPLSFTSPLYHAEGAQRAIELIFEDCARDAACAAAFPRIEAEFAAVLDRLEEGPVEVSVVRPDTGQPASVSFPRTWFAEAIRLLMYRAETARSIPYLVHRAYHGDFEILAQFVVDRRYAQDVGGDTIGMLLSVTCPEDLARIDESRIPELTEGTFAGDERVRQQMAACEVWPTARLPRRFGDPVASDLPALLWSGSQDPVTPPKWGDEAAAHLENSLHLVIPAAHMIGGRCVDKLSRRFLKRASVRGLAKQRCLQGLSLPPFDVPVP